MSITVEVGLLSGKTACVRAGVDEDVATLKRRAQTALGVGKGQLVDSSGIFLDASVPIKHARLQNGDSLTLHINRVQVEATYDALAAILADGSVVTWGDAEHGGDSTAVQDQLKHVQQIQASDGAFAAILGDGSVVTWGEACHGGDSSAVQDQLRNVQQIQASSSAFAAILADGSVVTWGNPGTGGDSSDVQDQLKHVQQIQASQIAFAAILRDGSVVTWGDEAGGGDSCDVQHQLKNVQQIQACRLAFAAILVDGSVVTWGDVEEGGGDSSAVQEQLRHVQQIQASAGAFAAIRSDGSVVTWGPVEDGADSCSVQDQLKNVQQIQATNQAFAAILGDGSVVTWGDAEHGGDSTAVQDQLRNVQEIQATGSSFAAILGDGSVVTWGHSPSGGDCSAVQDELRNVRQIRASAGAFAAILRNGSVVTWGAACDGGDSSAVQDQLRNPEISDLAIPRHGTPHLWLCCTGAKRGKGNSPGAQHAAIGAQERSSKSLMKLLVPSVDQVIQNMEGTNFLKVNEHRFALHRQIVPRCQEFDDVGIAGFICTQRSQMLEKFSELGDMIFFLTNSRHWRQDASASVLPDPLTVSHQMKYIDASFKLFHELVKRTELLVIGDVRWGRRAAKMESKMHALASSVDSLAEVEAWEEVMKGLKLLVRLWLCTFLGIRKIESYFHKRGWLDLLNTLNGFGLGASDVFVKLVSVGAFKPLSLSIDHNMGNNEELARMGGARAKEENWNDDAE
ncbi:hypothetical protein AK812_SmicGene25140 [Symbiodinium microadriaticum]|uniref:Ubiquitin-like domain-containing protein n=1 Tax=Symbiodinium microadriaticum TaxID=2951 RepID=A0A1Q9DCP7_SYMMI|nr:hypothetical protein AK812_SmicGene25140 [Symbiodinium microadriaticum]